MANIKIGLDYFPMDTITDDKIDLIQSKYGLIGFGFIVKLLSKIYHIGYYYRFGELEKALLSAKLNINTDVIDNIMTDCFVFNFLNKPIFDKYKIITSHGIQKRYFEAIKRRKQIYIIDEILLVNLNDYISTQNVNIIKVNVNINDDNVDTLRQSKLKETKVDKTILPEKEFSDQSLKFVEWFNKLIPERYKPKNLKQVNNWRECFDKMINIDKRTIPDIRAVCEFARNDDFWSGNFYTPLKLRKSNDENICFFDVFFGKIKKDLKPIEKEKVVEKPWKPIV